MDPKRIGKYDLTKFLGGGMSHVYMARDTLIGRTVAIKVLTESGAADEGTKARFIREAQLAGNVVHENIIRVYDFGEEDGRLFMVMEFLEGEDLCDALKRGHAGTIEDRIRIALQIARAMEHIHSLQIVHRDLKPQNVYITSSGIAKLMDFGIAKTDQTSMTKTGFTMGTPSYMAPEQVLGKQVNHVADIYAFGVLLFELITGAKPFSGESLERVFWLILNEPVDLAPLREAGAPQGVIELIRRCTEKNPAARPQSFAEVQRQLEEVLSGGAARGQPVPRPAPGYESTVTNAKAAVQQASPDRTGSEAPATKGKKWVIPAAVAVVLLGISVVFLWRPHRAVPGAKASDAAASKTISAMPPARLELPSGDMVLVAAGPFLFGEQKEKRETPAYYVDRTEVTNAAYAEFLKATKYAPPPDFASGRPDLPVVNVTTMDAREFARWASKRLPTAIEWEKAARGADGRNYPWGNQADPSLAAVRGSPLEAAGVEKSTSPYGAVQMTGNVWEMLEERVVPKPEGVRLFATRPEGARLSPKPSLKEPWCMIRGGSYLSPLFPVYEFSSIPERARIKDVGFRCVRDGQ